MASWSNINLQDSSSPLMEQLIFFHDHTLVILIVITVVVGYMMMTLIFNNMINRLLLEGQLIELVWTLLPALTLIFIALPSLRLLYMLDEVNNPLLTVKIIGHQWYWSYEYSDFLNVEFDSYMKPTEDLGVSEFRLIETDNHMILPFNIQVRLVITSSDVLHSWAMPSIGTSVDAVPGRLNQSSILVNRPGLLYGQCSEICGANHSFMPIVIESVSNDMFLNWLKTY
uniref:Cytochrome c oxidase subunit 2 n=1 Tax=Tettigades chilensis TaxID=1986882 RepID=A0A343S5F4_9HEMI|nr:cytochrome oxidase subunit II [Tettigades chilensis]AWV83863.1 cytochrome oxidase subunit II [Tettigades chilensis]